MSNCQKALRSGKIHWILISIFPFYVSACFAAAETRHFLSVDDIAQLSDITDPRCSPGGDWVAYTVTASDIKADKRRSRIWMVSWDGRQNLPLTFGKDSESSPRWSPDGKYLSFLADRPDQEATQVWIIDRRGGEARALTNVEGSIDSYEWSPDGKKLLLVMQNAEAVDAAPKPIVINRSVFKADWEGYVTEASRRHLYLFDVETKTLEPLTSDPNFNDSDPAWAPDGKQIAYVSNHEENADQSANNEVYLIEPRPGALPEKLLTDFAPNGQSLLWSPDGQQLAYLIGSEAKDYAYMQDKLGVVDVQTGKTRVLTEDLDRMVSAPQFSSDGNYLTFMVNDDRIQYPAIVPARGGKVERSVKQPVVATEQSRCKNGAALTVSSDAAPSEIYALEKGKLRKLTAHNDKVLADVQLGAVEDIEFNSADGTDVHGLMVLPPDYQEGNKYPTIVWIHGGPNMQDDHALYADTYPLQIERQFLAANGYVVLAINYRGGSGRGADYARAIFADWGHKEVDDLLAGVDHAIERGIADPDRLGIGGWSYGGILTDYTIARDSRFKAAISGAGSANMLGMYGVDQYAMQWSTELGAPWENQDLWLQVSYPFFQANRIKTPTLFLGGEKDFNVPIAGGEQMYQALRDLGVPTQLVVYPGEYHLLERPSFIRDRQERWLEWFGKYLK